jgi:tetratricopeptide (TPR) repeat protein
LKTWLLRIANNGLATIIVWVITSRHRIYRVLLLATTGLAGCAMHSQPSPTTNQIAQATGASRLPIDSQASLALDQIQPVPALDEPATQPASDRPPLEALLLYAKAREAENVNQRSGAIDYLEQASRADPASFDVQSELARLYLSMNASGDQAAEALERAADLKPDDLQTQTDLGRVYLARGDMDRALKHLRLALQTTEYRQDDDSAAITDYYLAQTLQKQGYDRAALDEYTRLLDRMQHAPESVHGNSDLDYWMSRPDLLYAEVARLYEKQGEPQDALAAYQLVAEHSPDDLETQAHIVRLLMEVGRRDEAAHDAINQVVRTHASPPSLALLREAYQGDNSGAVTAMRRLYRQHPDDRSVLFALVDLLETGGQSSEAQHMLTKVVNATTDRQGAGDTQVLRKLFDELSNQGKTIEAAKLLVETSARRPDAVNELVPMWIDLRSLTRQGRLQDSQLQTLQVPATALAARSYWVARLAVGRPELLKSSLDDSMTRDPVFAPAYRFALSRILSDDALKPNDRQQRVNDLVALAHQHGNEGLGKELLGTALLSNADNAKVGGDSGTAEQLAATAGTAFQQAEKLGDVSPDLRLQEANAELLLSDSARYEHSMWKLVADRPDDEEAYRLLLQYYESHDQAERSVAVSQNWLQADPTNVAARLLRVQLLSRAGVADEAEHMLGDLYKERPEDPQVLEMMRAVLAQDHGSNDRFVSVLETRLAEYPGDLAAADHLVDEYVMQNKSAEALHLIDNARNAVAKDADQLYFAAHLYDRVGEKDAHRDESIKTLQMALKLEPDNAGVNNDLGYEFADAGQNLANAETMIRHAVELEPDNAAYLDSLGWVLYKRGQFAESRGYLEKAIIPESDADPVVLNHLGDDLYRLSATADAQRRWQSASDRLDEQLKQRANGVDSPDNELAPLKQELKEKLRQIQSGGPANVAPVIETDTNQAHR